MASREKSVNAIELLESQHREVDELFEQISETEDDEEVEQLFVQLADKLAMHAKIEELHFYPAVKAARTEDILLESLEEHLGIKRALADLIDMDPADETFDAKVKVLQELVEHHVEEEESDLFPKVRKILSADQLTALAQEMAATQAELEGTDPRLAVPAETGEAPRI
jgi:hemerythrin superfamily protein